ncbi:MAG TPA: hypothetical protein VN224_01320 [Xanthomonadales bacterium]|nr:hypothetical protein [Xanthomonadales bacterium]
MTVERALLDEFKQVAGNDAKLPALVSAALRREIRRLGMLALLEEMERKNPSSAKSRAAGERLWRTAGLSLTPEPSPRSRKKTQKSATP